MDKKTNYEELYNKLNSCRGEELWRLAELDHDIQAISNKLMALRRLLQETDREVADRAETMGEEQEEQEEQ